MRSFCEIQGVSIETHNGIEDYARFLVSTLEDHFASGVRPSFLFGEQPCRGDFSLYGPLWAHLYRDPFSRSMFDFAPGVVRWLERLHGHAVDPAFPDLPTSCSSESASRNRHSGGFLPSDRVPEALDPLFRTIFDEHWPFLERLCADLDAHVEQTSAGGGASPVPRALGKAPFSVRGAHGERRLLTYSAWRLLRALDFYRSIELAPSRSLELGSADAWLMRVGALEKFRLLKPKWRIERKCDLPVNRETFWATRAMW